MHKFHQLFSKNSNHSYYSKLVKSFLIVAFCSSTLLLIIVSAIFLNKINKSTTQYNQAILKNTQVEIQKTVESSINIARQISMSQHVVKYLSNVNKTDYMEINEINLTIMNIVSNNDYMDSIHVVYPDRNMVITSYGLYSLDFFPDKTWLALNSMKKDTNTIQWYGKRDKIKDRLTGLNAHVITLSMKIMKKNITGYIIINIKDNFIANKLKLMQTKKSNILVQTEDGTLISSSQNLTQKTFTEIYSPHIKKLEYFNKKLINIEGDLYIFTMDKSNFNEWIYVAYTPINSIIFEYLGFILFLILFMLIIIVISCSFALSFGKIVYQPVQSFIDNILDKDTSNVLDKYTEFDYCSTNVNSIRKEKEKLLRQIDYMRPSLIDKLFHELLDGDYLDEHKLIELLDFLHISYQYKKYVVASLRIDEYDQQLKTLSHEESIFYQIAIRNFVVETCMKQLIFIQCVELDFKNSSFIFGFTEEGDIAKQIENIITTIMDFVHKNFDFTITIGVGQSVNELISIFISSNQSMEALNQSVFYGNNQSIYFKNIDGEFMGSYINPLIYEKKLSNTIRTFNKVETVQILNDIQSLIRKNRYDIRLIRQFYLSVLNMVFFIEQGISKQSDTINIQLNDLTKKIYQKESLHGINLIVENACMDICARVEEQNLQNRKQMVNTILTYLQTNYTLDISLNDVATKVSYTPTYINKILKSSLQKTFYEILTEIRINKAKELLQNTDLQIYQIAEMIGYSNVQSFIRVFKKSVNITPGKYREIKFDEFNNL